MKGSMHVPTNIANSLSELLEYQLVYYNQLLIYHYTFYNMVNRSILYYSIGNDTSICMLCLILANI